MSSALEITVTSGEPRQVWCDRCLTSAAIEFDIYGLAVVRGEPHICSLGSFRGCTTCDPDLFADTD